MLFSTNKKSILLALPFLLASITSESFGESFWLLCEIKRDRAKIEYILSKIVANKSYVELDQDIEQNKDNKALFSLLTLAFKYKLSSAVTNVLMYKVSKDPFIALAAKMYDRVKGQEEYDKNIKPFVCNHIFASTTQEQLAKEIKEAPSSSKQALVFDLAKHCNCVEDSWQEYAAKHNIEIKTNHNG